MGVQISGCGCCAACANEMMRGGRSADVVDLRTVWHRVVAALVLVAVVGGCSRSEDTSEPTVTTATQPATATTAAIAPTASVPSTTSTARAGSTTSRIASTTSTVDVYYSIATHSSGWHPEALPESGGWWGSGCSPGSDTLPDGIWWGYLNEFSRTSVTFDLACIVFLDESDNDPATEDYAWVIENKNPRVRIVPVNPAAQVTCDWMHCPSNPFPYLEWTDDDRLPHGDHFTKDNGLWLYVNGGAVTEIDDMDIAG